MISRYISADAPAKPVRHAAAARAAANCLLLAVSLICCASSAASDEGEGGPSARALIERAHLAAGGEVWRRPQTLHMRGRASFFDSEGRAPPRVAHHYEMWRVYPDWNDDAHGASGKVRIDARSGERVLFQIAYNGSTTWNQDGVVADAQASEDWSEAFGFGIIRFALDEGFELSRLADDQVEGHPSAVVRVSDPRGGKTLFWLDLNSDAIRQVGFDTPRGWHTRIYSDFYAVDPPGWQQPGRVRLYYDGVLANDIHWSETRVNVELADSLFDPPQP